MAEITKRCQHCKQDKPESGYTPSVWRARYGECRECLAARHRKKYVPKHGADDLPRPCARCGVVFAPKTRRVAVYCSRECAERSRAESGRQYDRHLQRKYGITLAEYRSMLDAQGGGCAICGRHPEDQSRYQTLHVDHCHDTGRVRGLLCDQHNLLLGRFDHDPDLLRRAADYLEA